MVGILEIICFETQSEIIDSMKRSFSNKTVQCDELAAGNGVF